MSPDRGLGLLWLSVQFCIVLLPMALGARWLLARHVLGSLGAPLPGARAVWWKAVLGGAGLGFAALALSLLPALLAGAYNPASPGWQAFNYAVDGSAPGNAGILALLLASMSLYEELAFRGLLLSLFALLGWWLSCKLAAPPEEPAARQRWNRRLFFICGLTANLLVALAFGAVHLGNPAASLGAAANVALAGILLGLCFWERVDVAKAWGLHFAWNLGLALLGLPVSGWAILPAPLGFGFRGAVPGPLTGGAFGPEDSLCATVALGLLAAVLLRRQLRWLQDSAGNGPSAGNETIHSLPASE